ncbi:homoserine dehydrogenase [Desulfitibacter alkalitolerans]|uniref:homoserine dehydrogenase n=1 Tax=Desulfitibacter alkalitolerans TaxID=264641 RepID=UPI00054FE9D8|nr:homoserine dehydrogenase [Desulfitibacter alkalitolerans]
MDTIKVGLLGLGTVGTGVAKVLKNNQDSITKKVGKPVELAKVLVNNTKKQRSITLPDGVITDKPEDVLDNPEISIIVEVMGGIEPAKDYIIRALDNDKHVVTANKDLIAIHGKELFEAAQNKNSDLFFEASVAGGIPIIRPLKECLAGNRLEQVMGIINGTTNYILTKMTQEGSDFSEVLKEAQDLGYAEADPTADIEGYDAARKIAILASVAFGTRVTFSDVYVEGITKITAEDIQYARDLGYVIKLLGIANSINGHVEVRVHPAFIPKHHPLAAVNDVFNAIFIKGDAIGEAMFFGRGAGEMPTASAVVGDIVAAARDIVYGVTGRISCTCFEEKPIIKIGEIQSEYYLRLKVADKPGVLASIAGVFGNHDVSIASVVQKSTGKNGKAEIVLITHKVNENSIRDALQIIGGMSIVDTISNVIRVEGGNK